MIEREELLLGFHYNRLNAKSHAKVVNPVDYAEWLLRGWTIMSLYVSLGAKEPSTVFVKPWNTEANDV